MKLEPISQYTTPKLPTRKIVDAHPELLRLLPKRWQGNAAVVTALMGAGLLMQSSGSVLAEQGARLAGDVMITVSLSESEARRIIVEEAKRAGVTFAADRKTLDISLGSLNTTPQSTEPEAAATTHITLDGTNTKLGVSYEYISDIDEKALSARGGGVVSSESAAAAIRAESSKALKGRVLVIPGVETYSREEADRQLRAQVKDFIKWLKAQGVI